MDETKMHQCLVCRSDQRAAKKLFIVSGYPLMQCTICRFVYLGTQLEWEDKKLLNEQRYGGTRQGQRSRMLVREDRLALNQISQYARYRTLLEVGCGDGGFLIVAKSQGWDVWGVELSRGAAQAAALKLGGSKIHCGTIQDWPFPREAFDVVVMKSFIEHVPDPRADLEVAWRLLKPNGYLYLLTPNIESLEAKVYGRRWFALVPGDHLWFFSPETLKSLLETTGFETRWLITTESYEDVVVGVLFLFRNLLGNLVCSVKQPTSEVMTRSRAPRTVAFGISPRAKHTAERILEMTRYLNVPWFLVYSHLLMKTSLGACIRGVFQKARLNNAWGGNQ